MRARADITVQRHRRTIADCNFCKAVKHDIIANARIVADFTFQG
jgi:hypothetical protein